MRRTTLLLLLSLAAPVAGCGGGHKPETARDVEQRLMRVHSGPFANPASVTCRPAGPKWWNCAVTTSGGGPNALGESVAEIEVPAH